MGMVPTYDARSKQPIMRIEDRLFDRGWVRSAMATRKCGNIYFPKYFMAVTPFLTRKFFQEILGLEGLKISWGKKTFLTRKCFGKISAPKISSGKKTRILPAEKIFEPKISWRQEEILGGNFGIT